MDERERIPIDVVIKDMASSDGIVSSAASAYFQLYYGNTNDISCKTGFFQKMLTRIMKKGLHQ